MQCTQCQTKNVESSRRCIRCGSSLTPARTQAHLDRAEAALNQGNHDLATAALAEADREMFALTSEQRNQLLLTPRAFHLQAMLYYNKGLMNEARAELLSAERILVNQPNGKVMLAQILNLLGNVLNYLDQIDESNGYYERCIEIALEANAHEVAAKGYSNLASTYFERNEYDTAIEYYTKGMEQARLSDNPTSLAQSYRMLTLLHSYCGPFERAQEYAVRSLALLGQIPSLEIRSFITSQAASVYIMGGDFARARTLLRSGNELAKQSDSELAKEALAVSLSELLRERLEPESWYGNAMKVFRDIASGAMMREEATLRLAIYYISLGNPDYIRRHLHWVRENRFGASYDEDSVEIDYASALLHSALDEYAEAANYFKLALNSGKFYPYQEALAWQEYGEMLLRWASSESKDSNYADVRAAFERAADIFSQIEVAYRLNKVQRLLSSLPSQVD